MRKNIEQKRVVGLDLLRFLAMLGIIGLHVMNQGGVIHNAKLFSFNYSIYLLVLIILYLSVNIFGLLSGYLLIEKEKIKHSRIIELLFIAIFWSIIITGIFYIFNISNIRSFGKKELLFGLIPLLADNNWYLISYIILFFMIPYLNKVLNILEKDKYKKLLITLFIFFTIIPNLLGHSDLFKLSYGYSPFWLIYLYMIGGYLKRFNITITKKNGLLLLFSSVIGTFGLNYLYRIICFKHFGYLIQDTFLIDYVSPLTVISSILVLLLFKDITINNSIITRIIKYLSTMAFSVYIIHCHRFIFINIIKDLFIPLLDLNGFIFIIVLIGILLITYNGCVLLDEIRKFIFRILNINKIIDYLGVKMDKYYN